MSQQSEIRALKGFYILALVFMFVALAAIATGHAQDCNQVVFDGANVLGRKAPSIEAGAKNLVDQGADVHVLTFASLGGSTIESLASNLQRDCPSWQSANKGVKANLLILALAPKDRKMAILYGPGYKAALDGQTDRIKRDYMAPYFRGADWAGGFISAEQQLGSRIKASLDESNKPTVNETTNQATDFHGLWVFLWILAALALSGGIGLLIYLRKRSREETDTAQQEAIAARSRVVNLLTDVTTEVNKYSDIAAAPDSVKQAMYILDNTSKQYALFAGSMSGDPTTEGMSKSFYDALSNSYSRMEDDLVLAKSYTKDRSYERVAKTKKKASTPTKTKGEQSVAEAVGYDAEPAPPPPSAPQTTRETVIVNNSSSDLLTGVLLGEAMTNRSEPEPEHPHAPKPEPEPEPEPSKSDDSWSGSSSSFDSSSSFGDSSSSSFGSDSGGGFGGDSSSF